MPLDQTAFFAATERTVARAIWPRDTCAVGFTARQRPPTGRRLVTAYLTVGRAARRTGAQRQLHGQGLRSLRAPRRGAIATSVLFEEDVHAVRADPPQVPEAAVMRAPEEGIVLEDSPLQPSQRRNDCAEMSFDGGSWSRTVALLRLHGLDTVGHGG